MTNDVDPKMGYDLVQTLCLGSMPEAEELMKLLIALETTTLTELAKKHGQVRAVKKEKKLAEQHLARLQKEMDEYMEEYDRHRKTWKEDIS